MATINSILDGTNHAVIPSSVPDWMAFDSVESHTLVVDDTPVSCGVFSPAEPKTAGVINIFAGGIPRDERRWPVLPVINRFFGYVAAGLALENTTGISFNWPGLGDTPGEIMESSIDTRTDFLVDLAEAALDEFDADKVNFIGASMGAYCAALAADRLAPGIVERQAFLSLPAYPRSSHALTYADGFGAEIRRDWDLGESPIYGLLAGTATPTMVAYSEHDEPPIPRAIQEGFQAAAGHNQRLTHHVIEGVYHNFRRTPDDVPGEAIDIAAVRQFGNTLIKFIGA